MEHLGLLCEQDEYLRFFDLCTKVYTGDEAPLVFLVGSIIPSDFITNDSIKISRDEALGVPSSVFINESEFYDLFNKIKKSVCFDEIFTKGEAGLKDQIDDYLSKRTINNKHPFYERYLVAFYNVMALIFSFYLDDKSKSDEDFVLRDDECKKAIESAEYLQKFLDKGGEMKSYDSASKLNYNLQELINSNSPYKVGSTKYKRTSHLPSKKSNNSDYALRNSIFRLVIFFKIVHHTTPTKLIKTISVFINPKISSGTIDNYIKAAKNYMADKNLMKHDIVPEIFDAEARWRVIRKGGLNALVKFHTDKDKEYRKEIMKKNTSTS